MSYDPTSPPSDWPAQAIGCRGRQLTTVIGGGADSRDGRADHLLLPIKLNKILNLCLLEDHHAEVNLWHILSGSSSWRHEMTVLGLGS